MNLYFRNPFLKQRSKHFPFPNFPRLRHPKSFLPVRTLPFHTLKIVRNEPIGVYRIRNGWRIVTSSLHPFPNPLNPFLYLRWCHLHPNEPFRLNLHPIGKWNWTRRRKRFQMIGMFRESMHFDWRNACSEENNWFKQVTHERWRSFIISPFLLWISLIMPPL